MSYFVEIIPEPKGKRLPCLDSMLKKLRRYSKCYWIFNPYDQKKLCCTIPAETIFRKKILPSISRIENESKVYLNVTRFDKVK